MSLFAKTASARTPTPQTGSDIRTPADLTLFINEHYDQIIDEMNGGIDSSQLMGLFREGSQRKTIEVTRTKVKGSSVASVNEDGDDIPFINRGQGWAYSWYTFPYRIGVKHTRRMEEEDEWGTIADDSQEMADAFSRTVYYSLADVLNRGISPTSAPFLCPDGMYLIDTARPNPVVGAPAWGNQEPDGDLTEDYLFDAQISAQLTRAHNGDLMPQSIKKFLIPVGYDKIAWKLRETSGTVGNAMNDANWAKGRFNYETVPELIVNNIFFLLGDPKSKANGLQFRWGVRPNVTDINFTDPDVIGKRLRARFGLGSDDPRAMWRGGRLNAL